MLLTRKELLLPQAPLTAASLTAQSHLGRAGLSLLKMLVGKIRKALDEDRVAVQALGPLDTRAIGLLHDFQIQLVQGLNVVAGESDGHKDKVRLAALHILHHRILGLGTQPGFRANLGLPTQPVRVAELQALHDGVDGCGNFGRVGVTLERAVSIVSSFLKGWSNLPRLTTSIGRL